VTDSPDFFSVARSQRAHRAFRDEPVPDELVERVLEVATYAPSAENTQPWAFVVLRDTASRARVGELTRRAWESGGRDFSRPRLSPRVFAKVEAGATGGVANAPVLVVVCGDTSRCVEAVLDASVFPATQNLLLAAQALGLGAALTTLTTTFADELRALLALPDHVRAMAVVPLGWPAQELGPPRRAPVAEKAFRERYGAPWVEYPAPEVT
jgi:nitroreductase